MTSVLVSLDAVRVRSMTVAQLNRATDGRQLCASAPDPELYFPLVEDPAEARTLCAGCPVQAECGERAYKLGATWGYWGGMTSDERDALNRNRPDIPPAPPADDDFDDVEGVPA